MVGVYTLFVKLATVLLRKREVLFLILVCKMIILIQGFSVVFFQTLQASLEITLTQTRHLPLSATWFPVYSS